MDIVDITSKNFEQEVLRSDLPVAIDCWATWCGPCKTFSPVFEATAEQYEGAVKFVKLDVDAEPALAAGLGIRAMPTTLILYKAQIANAVEGALPAEHFQQWVYQTTAAIHQYSDQFDAEAEEAINAAVSNLTILDENGTLPTTAEDLLDPAAGEPPAKPSGFSASPFDIHNPGLSPQRDDKGPGKRTASGLYIP